MLKMQKSNPNRKKVSIRLTQLVNLPRYLWRKVLENPYPIGESLKKNKEFTKEEVKKV